MSGRPLVLAAVVSGLLAAACPATFAGDGKVLKRKGAAEAAVPVPQNVSFVARHEAEQPAEAAVGDTWSPQEIAAAKERCAAALKTVAAVTVAEEPIRAGNCGAAAPVKLISIGRVVFSPPPTLTCDMVAALGKWLSQDVQPLAKAHLGAALVKIENMSSYSCRNALGRVASRLSEHGRVNALDIGGFVTSTGETATVLAGWGPTAREISAQVAAAAKLEADRRAEAERQEQAERKAAAERAAQQAQAQQQIGPQPAGQGSRLVSFGLVTGANSAAPEAGDLVGQIRPGQYSLPRAARLGGPREKAPETSAIPAIPADAVSEETRARRTRFLRATHAAACKHFGTVLGPEANAYHRNHFHVDMADRKRSHFCE